MKALIMAAGKGSRISDNINGVPKSTLPLSDGTPVIRRIVQNMLLSGIQPCVCVGYQQEKVREVLMGLDIQYYVNPFYEVTNNIATLWFAKEVLCDEDIILTSADLYYPKEFLNLLKESNAELTMLVDSTRITSGDFYFHVNDYGFINEYGPDVPLDKRKYEYMGLLKICKDRIQDLKKRMEYYIMHGKYNMYFEDLVISMNIKDHVPISFVDVQGSFWKEFDVYEDYLDILRFERGK